MKKKIGIIGFGGIGKRHAHEFREATCGMIEVAGVVELSEDMYKKGCEWNNLTSQQLPRFDNPAAMFKQLKLDGVIISSPNWTHLENLQQLAGMNIPVLIEKPLDTSLEKVADIVRFCSQYQGKVVVDHVMRYAPIIRRAKQLIVDGKLGKICSFQFTHRNDVGIFHCGFRRSIAKGGSHMIEKATHDLDVALYLTDALPEKVAMISRQQVMGGKRANDLRCHNCPDILTCPEAYTESKTVSAGFKDVNITTGYCAHAQEVDVPDNETCLIKMSRGIFGTYAHTYFCKMPGHSRTYEVIGTEGALYIKLSAEDPSYRGLLYYYPRNKDGEKETFDYNYSNKIHYFGGPYVARHFYNLMCGTETQPFTTVNQAFVAEALGFAAMRSAADEQFVNVLDTIPDDLKDTYSATYR